MKISTSQPPGKWFPSLVCGMIAVACLVLGAATSAFSQHVSVGIKAGVPLTDVVPTDRSFQAQTRRYTIGPVVDIGLPLGLGIEVGAMYKRVDQQAWQLTVGQPPYICFMFEGEEECDINVKSTYLSHAGQSWEFPVAGQYHISLPMLRRPYVEAGFSYNHLSDVFSPFGPTFPRTLQAGQVISFPRSSENRAGALGGAGFELKLGLIHVTPGLRYTRYKRKAESWLPSLNAVDFLLGITFEADRRLRNP